MQKQINSKSLRVIFYSSLIISLGLISCKKDDEKCVEQTWYKDADGDGYGDPNDSKVHCSQPEGYVLDNSDCDDTDALVSPDETITWHRDADGDGFGDSNDSKSAPICSQPEGYVGNNEDCNDNDASIHPGAEDLPNDGIDSNCDGQHETTIWTGEPFTFTKPGGADWTLPENQDILTEKVIFTRQTNRHLYNYKWWLDNLSRDATSDELNEDFWDEHEEGLFEASGGNQGVRWAILDNTGIEDNHWNENFNLYGTLGDPTHFYSLHNIGSIIRTITPENNVTNIIDDFYIETENGSIGGTKMSLLVGKKLGVWLVEEDIYLTLTFTEWGEGEDGKKGSVSYIRSTK